MDKEFALSEVIRRRDTEKTKLLLEPQQSAADTPKLTEEKIGQERHYESATEPLDHIDQTPARPASEGINGYVCVILAALLLSASVGLSQYLAQAVPESEMNALRFAALGLLLLPYMVYGGCAVKVELSVMKWLALVGVVFCVMSFLEYSAFAFIAVGSATAVLLSTVLILETLATLAVFRKIHLNMVLASVLSIAGIILITQPTFIFKSGDVDEHNATLNKAGDEHNAALNLAGTCFGPCLVPQNATDNEDQTNTSSMNQATPTINREAVGYTFIFVSGCFVMVKDFTVNVKLGQVGLGVYCLWVSLIGTVLSLVFMAATVTPTWPQCWACSLVAVGQILTASGGRALWFLAVQRIRPLTATICTGSIMLLVNSILQYTLLSSIHTGHANWEEYLGFALIVIVLIMGPGVELFREIRNISAKEEG